METNDIDLTTTPAPFEPVAATKIKIVSDGTPHGTYLLDLLTNRIIANVTSVDIQLLPGEVPLARITIIAPELEIRADAYLTNHKDSDHL